MRIAVIRGCIIRVHPLFPCLILLFIMGGAASFAVAFLSALILHETAHFLCAVSFHLPVSQIELTPFGGSMQIPQLDGLSSAKAFTLSCAGPLCNALMIGLCAVFSRCFMFVPPAIFAFVRCNLLMLLVNLLPVLPLDGGRMLLALLSSVFDRARILRILLMLGRVLAVSLLIAGFYLSISGSFHISLITLGCYLLYAAAIEEKTGTSRYLAAFISRRIRLEKHGILPVQTLCVTSALPVFMLIEHLRSGAYHLITVLDENSQQPIGQLCETQLISSLLEKSHASIGEILRSGK